jgi:hypothetical protein
MFEVHSWTEMSTGETKLVIGQKGEGSSSIVYNLYTGWAHRVELGEKVPPEYVLTLPWNMSQEIENALAQWLARKGIRNDQDAKFEGTLDATRYHLEDLRELLKLSPKEEAAGK